MNHPMGPTEPWADLRPRYLPGHHGGPLQRIRRLEIPAVPSSQKICGCGYLAERQRKGFLYLLNEEIRSTKSEFRNKSK